MADRIVLSGLKARGHHGVYEHERRDGQDFLVDATLWLDSRPAAASDDLADTVDYGAITATAARVAETLAPQLLEHLAGCVADEVLALDPRITIVTVTVRKLAPPVPERLSTSGVRLTRTR